MAARKTPITQIMRPSVDAALRNGGYTAHDPKMVIRLEGEQQNVSITVATDGAGRAVPIQLRGQDGSGTAEQKVPFYLICLAQAVRESNGRFEKAYLVLVGDGWTLRDFYVNGGLNKHLVWDDLVEIVTLETFLDLANRGQL
ncbi:MAG: hypothetical protein JW384_02242 [Nitrosomonadaceae bacterium]|nr:hypothetical protein [Nitrosomonadaceae bacterium]